MAAPGVFDSYTARRATNGMTEFKTLELIVAASQTINPGDILSLSSGKLQQSIAAPTAGTTSLSGGNLAIAGAAIYPITTDSSGNNTSGAVVPSGLPVTTLIAVFDDSTNVLLRCATTNGASQTLANFTIGNKYQFGRFTNAAGTLSWYFLSPTTTNGEFIFEQIPQDLAFPTVSTSTYPTVWVKAILSATVRQLG